MALKKIGVNLKLPFVDVSGEWDPQDLEVKAAWELYVELVTRVPVAELIGEEGILREALSSLYSLFGATREILRRYGPDVARQTNGGGLTFGYLAVALLNGALRPLLAYWHPRLQAFEATRQPGISPVEHEATWEQAAELRDWLTKLRVALIDYSEVLANVTNAPSLMKAVDDTRR